MTEPLIVTKDSNGTLHYRIPNEDDMRHFGLQSRASIGRQEEMRRAVSRMTAADDPGRELSRWSIAWRYALALIVLGFIGVLTLGLVKKDLGHERGAAAERVIGQRSTLVDLP